MILSLVECSNLWVSASRAFPTRIFLAMVVVAFAIAVSSQTVCSHRLGLRFCASLMITCYRVVILHKTLMTASAGVQCASNPFQPNPTKHASQATIRPSHRSIQCFGLYGLDHGSGH